MKTQKYLFAGLILVVLFALFLNSCTTIHREFEQSISSKNPAEISGFISKHEAETKKLDKSSIERIYLDSARKVLDSIREETNWKDIRNNLTLSKIIKHKEDFPKCKRDSAIEKFVRVWYYEKCTNHDSCFKALRKMIVLKTPLKDISNEILNKEYENDVRFINSNISENNLDSLESSYERLREKYSGTSKVFRINRKLAEINKEIIKKILENNPDQLPAPERNRFSLCNSPETTLEIYDSTKYTLTVRYSGPESKKVVLEPFQKKTIYLKNGEYKVTATVNLNRIEDYAGDQKMDGRSYTSKFIIVTRPVYNNTYKGFRFPGAE